MDARIHPSKAFGLALGDAHVIRNAGGNAKDAIRSLVISQQLLGTKAIFLVKHTGELWGSAGGEFPNYETTGGLTTSLSLTGCGMLTFDNKAIHTEIIKNLYVSAAHIDFQPFNE